MTTQYIRYPGIPIYDFPLLAPSGSVSAPSYSFTSGKNYGMFLDSTSLAFAANGIEALTASSTGVVTIGATNATVTHLLNGLLQATAGASQDAIYSANTQTANRSAVFLASQLAGSTTGGAFFRAQVSGGTNWSAGLDAPTSSYKIAQANGFASNVFLTITTAGATTLGGTLTATGITGVTDASNAAAGNVGEYFSSAASATNVTTTITYQNLNTLTLTAGDYDVFAYAGFRKNGATMTGGCTMGISLNSASSTGTTFGDDRFELDITNNSSSIFSPISVHKRVNVSSTTSVYQIVLGTFSAGNPQVAGNIFARRVR